MTSSEGVRWFRDHAGASTDPARWAGVWVPLADVAADLERALRRGDNAYLFSTAPRGAVAAELANYYVDFSRLYDPDEPARSEELSWWRRRTMPRVAALGLRKLDGEGIVGVGRPKRFVKRVAPHDQGGGPALRSGSLLFEALEDSDEESGAQSSRRPTAGAGPSSS